MIVEVMILQENIIIIQMDNDLVEVSKEKLIKKNLKVASLRLASIK